MTSPTTFCELWIFFHTFLSLAVSFFKSLKKQLHETVHMFPVNVYLPTCTLFSFDPITFKLHVLCRLWHQTKKRTQQYFVFFGSKHEVLLQAEKGRKVCNKCNCFIPWISLWNIRVHILNKCFLPLFNAPWPIKPYLIWQQGLEVYGCLIVTSASVLVS